MLASSHLAGWPVRPYGYVNNGRNSFAEGSPGQVILQRAAENPQVCGGFLETLLPDVGDRGGTARYIRSEAVDDCCMKYSEVVGANIGPVKPARMFFSVDGTYSLEVLLNSIGSGSWLASEPPHSRITSLLDTLLAHSGYTLCPGICFYEEEFAETIRFQSKNLRIWCHPAVRHDSNQCLLWHKPNNFQLQSTSPLFDLCVSCKTLYHDLSAIKKRAAAASPGHKEKWTESSSTHPLKYLSPASQLKKLGKKGKEVKKLRKALQMHESSPFDVELSNEQDIELQQLVTAINQNGQSYLETIFQEADNSGEGCGDTLRECWERDVIERKQFFEDQLKNRE